MLDRRSILNFEWITSLFQVELHNLIGLVVSNGSVGADQARCVLLNTELVYLLIIQLGADMCWALRNDRVAMRVKFLATRGHYDLLFLQGDDIVWNLARLLLYLNLILVFASLKLLLERQSLSWVSYTFTGQCLLKILVVDLDERFLALDIVL